MREDDVARRRRVALGPAQRPFEARPLGAHGVEPRRGGARPRRAPGRRAWGRGRREAGGGAMSVDAGELAAELAAERRPVAAELHLADDLRAVSDAADPLDEQRTACRRRSVLAEGDRARHGDAGGESGGEQLVLLLARAARLDRVLGVAAEDERQQRAVGADVEAPALLDGAARELLGTLGASQPAFSAPGSQSSSAALADQRVSCAPPPKVVALPCIGVGEHHPVHLRGAVDQPRLARVAVDPFQDRVLGITARATELDRRVGRGVQRVRDMRAWPWRLPCGRSRRGRASRRRAWSGGARSGCSWATLPSINFTDSPVGEPDAEAGRARRYSPGRSPSRAWRGRASACSG